MPPTLSSISSAIANVGPTNGNPSRDQLQLGLRPDVSAIRYPVSGGLSPRQRRRLVPVTPPARRVERNRSSDRDLGRPRDRRASPSKRGDTFAISSGVASSLIAFLDGVNQREASWCTIHTGSAIWAMNLDPMVNFDQLSSVRRTSAHVVDHLGDRSRHDGSLKPALKPRQIPLGLDLPSDCIGYRDPPHAQHS